MFGGDKSLGSWEPEGVMCVRIRGSKVNLLDLTSRQARFISDPDDLYRNSCEKRKYMNPDVQWAWEKRASSLVG